MKLAGDAVDVTKEAGKPGLDEAAAKIAPAIVANVPVQGGGAKKTYHTSTGAGSSSRDGGPQARVLIDSPFWHFLEYGTQFNAPYRTIQNTVTGLGYEYVPR